MRVKICGVNSPVALDAAIEAVLSALPLDVIQLHGSETPERCAAIRARFGLPVMKALAIETKSDLGAIPLYARIADRLLFDARAPRDATRPGGLGKPFDWHLLDSLDRSIPFILSGGLDPGNVAEAIRITHAPAVDVSSGVESAPGVKDAEKVRAFIRAARASLGAGMSVG